MMYLNFKFGAMLIIAASASPAQSLLPPQAEEGAHHLDATKDDQESHHLLWIIPNYRTSPSVTDYRPLAAREKFKLAAEDSWDRGTVALGADLPRFSLPVVIWKTSVFRLHTTVL